MLPGDLLAGIEDIGEVDRGAFQLFGQRQHHGQTSFHVRAPEAPQDLAGDPGFGVVVGRYGIEMPGEHDPAGRPSEVRAITLLPIRSTDNQAMAAKSLLDVLGQRRARSG